MRTRLQFITTVSVFTLLVSGDQKPEIRWKSNKSQIVHHSLDKTRKSIEQEAGWLPLHDTCAENLEIPKVNFNNSCFWQGVGNLIPKHQTTRFTPLVHSSA